MANVVGSAVGIFLLWCCLWGFTTKAVVINRGYESEGRKYFWYGFWFGMFAVIVAFSKPQISDTVQPFAPRRVTPRWEPDGVVLDNGGIWKCTCGTVNGSGVAVCQCGRRKVDVLAEQGGTRR